MTHYASIAAILREHGTHAQRGYFREVNDIAEAATDAGFLYCDDHERAYAPDEHIGVCPDCDARTSRAATEADYRNGLAREDAA